jgi:hypothetical protein
MRLKPIMGSTAIFLAGLALLATASAQQSKSAPQQPASQISEAPASPLDAIAWLKGGAWVAELKDKDGAAATRIESRVRGSENGRLIKFTTTFISHNKPDLHYEGVYLYNPQAKQIEFYYTDTEGNFTRGHAAFADGRLTQDFEIIHMNGQAETLRSYVVRDGDNAYNWNVMSNKTGEWKELLHLHYVREGPADGRR